MSSTDLSKGSVPEAAQHIDQLVRVSGSTSKHNMDAVELLGTLLGITYTHTKVIVYMDGGQSTAFDRSAGVTLQRVNVNTPV